MTPSSRPDKWSIVNERLIRRYKFKSFADAIIAINRIAEIAEDLDHHPDIRLENYNELTLQLFTHSAKCVTKKDENLADLISQSLNGDNDN